MFIGRFLMRLLLVPLGGWDSPLSALMFSFAGFVFGAGDSHGATGRW